MPTSHAADQKAIRELDAQWGEAANRHDLEAVVAFYAPDATLVWPGWKAFHGTAGVRRGWKKAYAKWAGLGLTFISEDVTVSKDGGLAADFGRVILSMTGPDGKKVREVAKYLVTWKKVRGEWKVLYDCWNENSSS